MGGEELGERGKRGKNGGERFHRVPQDIGIREFICEIRYSGGMFAVANGRATGYCLVPQRLPHGVSIVR